MSCCFNPTTMTQARKPLPDRHVNHVQGMVLGVDEFRQEFTYLDGRDRWLARDLLGYGTVRGLGVLCQATAGAVAGQLDQWEVKVRPGVALDPCGHLVCVREEQCGHLNRWLAEHGAALDTLLGGAAVSGTLTLHLVLRYLDCLTDSLPIPGTPCRSEEQLKVPTRIADDFEIDFHLDAPAGSEERALRAFHRWLAAIPVLPWRTSPTLPADFETAVAAWTPTAAVPPAGITLGALDAADYLRQALRLWATVLRPQHFGRACSCVPDAPAAPAPPPPADGTVDGVLLATLRVDVEKPIGQPWRVKGVPAVSQADRPVLLPARTLADAAAHTLAAAAAGGSGWGQAGAAVPAVLGRFAASAEIKSGGVIDPQFGEVAIRSIKAGRIALSFAGYTPPDASHRYVVKALPVGDALANPGAPPVVAFEAFDADGFTLAIWRGAAAATQAEIEAMGLLVEVSELTVTAP